MVNTNFFILTTGENARQIGYILVLVQQKAASKIQQLPDVHIHTKFIFITYTEPEQICCASRMFMQRAGLIYTMEKLLEIVGMVLFTRALAAYIANHSLHGTVEIHTRFRTEKEATGLLNPVRFPVTSSAVLYGEDNLPLANELDTL
jgi:hypothetical protein